MKVPDLLSRGLIGYYMLSIYFQLGLDTGLYPFRSMVILCFPEDYSDDWLKKGGPTKRGPKTSVGRLLRNSVDNSAPAGMTGKYLAKTTLSIAITYNGYQLVERLQPCDYQGKYKINWVFNYGDSYRSMLSIVMWDLLLGGAKENGSLFGLFICFHQTGSIILLTVIIELLLQQGYKWNATIEIIYLCYTYYYELQTILRWIFITLNHFKRLFCSWSHIFFSIWMS